MNGNTFRLTSTEVCQNHKIRALRKLHNKLDSDLNGNSERRTGPAIPQTMSTTPVPPLLAPPSEVTETILSCLSDATDPEPTLTIHRRTHWIFRAMIDPAPHGSTRRYGRGAKIQQAEPKRSGPDPAERGPPCYRRRRVLEGWGFVMVGVGSVRRLGIWE
ncbi:hypothetical protein HO173_010039 [Letharia columbiana]|uniref:Uncharacterized protein n=1 Tax=Letharia columbiana TaxID=112416 RepID=A0A8H6L191_9LECA|nr:uncharacterized protein HO173_010039 [Letharia columbiana]KAF6231737.1 hypothetical protein HO173_010039 [Letharia columbiana]